MRNAPRPWIRLAAGVLLLTLSASLEGQDRKVRTKPAPATRACGSAVSWRSGLDAALEEARARRRPVLWYVPTTAGSRMDRKTVIDLYMMAGPFSCPQTVCLLNRRFVPVKEPARGAVQERYGLRHPAFIEPGLLVLAPGGEVLLRLHEITTLHNGWLRWQLRSALEGHPELARDSKPVARARASGDPQDLAAELLACGDAAAAAAALEAAGEPGTPRGRYLLGCARAGQGDVEAARGLLQHGSLEEGPWARPARVALGRLELAAGRYVQAAGHFELAAGGDGPRGREARFLLGTCRFLLGDREGARRAWSRLAGERPLDTWVAKASAEAQHLGPVSRGFEVFSKLPEDAFRRNPEGTCCPRGREDLPWILERCVRFLLAMQREEGYWDDSNYDFGGTDSLPNVYAAVTSLAALALHQHRQVDPEAAGGAVERAVRWLAEEEHLAWDDEDEILWAHAYRLLLLQELGGSEGDLAAPARRKAREVVRFLAEGQLQDGAWRHEYANPFATASALHALHVARRGGIPVPGATLTRGAAVLAGVRAENGTFPYGMRRRGRPRPEGAAGRTPLCELALLLSGRSDQQRLAAALEVASAHHGRLEAVRKVDDHADRYGNGGFFYWYDLLGRAWAVQALEDADLRKRYAGRLLDTVLAVNEIDGRFVDSHELGRVYGTAMALLTLDTIASEVP